VRTLLQGDHPDITDLKKAELADKYKYEKQAVTKTVHSYHLPMRLKSAQNI
jgi:hypothetical protein